MIKFDILNENTTYNVQNIKKDEEMTKNWKRRRKKITKTTIIKDFGYQNFEILQFQNLRNDVFENEMKKNNNFMITKLRVMVNMRK